MSKRDNETIGEELFIEELGEVRGGAVLIPGKELLRELGERSKLRKLAPPEPTAPTKTIWIEGTPLPEMTTMMWGGGENAAVPPTMRPMNDG